MIQGMEQASKNEDNEMRCDVMYVKRNNNNNNNNNLKTREIFIFYKI